MSSIQTKIADEERINQLQVNIELLKEYPDSFEKFKEYLKEYFKENLKEYLKEAPICCGVGGTNDCDKPCDLKMIGNEKSEMWGETDEFAKHPYHWNQCGDCFKKESGEDESDESDEDD
jgi:hypothetical protein